MRGLPGEPTLPVEPRVIWLVAHRGASSGHPENTLEAFEAAVAAGADVVELDARLSRDGHLVVMHDADLARSTGGSGFVQDLTLGEIKRRSGGRVPALAEALELLSGRVTVDVEIKNIPGEPDFDSPRERVAEALVRLLDRSSFSGTILASSFNWLSIERVRRFAPGVPTGFLTVPAVDAGAALAYASVAGHALILPQVRALLRAGPSLVERAHALGVRVGTWTVEDLDEMRRLFSWGVDAVATDDPEAAAPVRDAFLRK